MTKTIEKEKEREYKKGLWTVEEDKLLSDYVKVHGKGQWNLIAKKTGLKRCGKSCRLRWINYLSPSVKRSSFTEEEEDLIIRLHKLLGNRWSLIAKRVPGRTDNQVKNYWNTHLSKKLTITDQTRRVAESSVLLNSGNVDVPETSVTETCTTCDKSTSCATTHILVDHKVSQKAVNVADTQAYTMDEGFFSSLWVFDDDLMEFMASYSLI